MAITFVYAALVICSICLLTSSMAFSTADCLRLKTCEESLLCVSSQTRP
jgi:hypothetical protein